MPWTHHEGKDYAYPRSDSIPGTGILDYLSGQVGILLSIPPEPANQDTI
jgi:hypothetical protein